MWLLLLTLPVFQTNPLMALIPEQCLENDTVEVLYSLLKSLNERNKRPMHLFAFMVGTCVLG